MKDASTKKVILICKRVKYHSINDEAAFFEWIHKIKSITKYNGLRDELYLYMKSNHVPDADLREIIGLFYRYKIDMKQLKLFLNEANEAWFYLGKYKAYWHKKIFG
jgi:hypothetical protein